MWCVDRLTELLPPIAHPTLGAEQLGATIHEHVIVSARSISAPPFPLLAPLV